MPRYMTAKYNGKCSECGEPVSKGSEIVWSRATGALHPHCYSHAQNMGDSEYARGYNDVAMAQMMGPAGSAAREAAYMAMEAQWAREGFDG